MFLDDQIDNLGITKNCQKARDPIHPWSGVENMYLGWSSLALKPTIAYSFDLKIQKDQQNLQKQKAGNRAKNKLF